MTDKVERKIIIESSVYLDKRVVLSEYPKRCPFGKNRRKKYNCCSGCYDNCGGYEKTGEEKIRCGYIKHKSDGK